MSQIKIILGSTRQKREGEKVAIWIHKIAMKRHDTQFDYVDLRDWPLPFFNEPVSPAMTQGQPTIEIARRWAETIEKADGFIFVTPEYNHGYTAVLKNALDYLYHQWNNKPAAFVSYSAGPIAGARAVEQLRQVVVELQMTPIREEVNIPLVWQAFEENGEIKNQGLIKKAEVMLDQLEWWTSALREARQQVPLKA